MTKQRIVIDTLFVISYIFTTYLLPIILPNYYPLFKAIPSFEGYGSKSSSLILSYMYSVFKNEFKIYQ